MAKIKKKIEESQMLELIDNFKGSLWKNITIKNITNHLINSKQIFLKRQTFKFGNEIDK